MSAVQAEGGCRPASRPPFLASPRIAGQRKGGKEGAPCCPRPFRYAAGQPAPSTSWGCAAKLTARRRRFVQTAAASQCTKQLHSTVQLPAPRGWRHRRGQKGQCRMRDSFFINLIAASVLWVRASSQSLHNSRRPSVSACSSLAAPAARGSGCGHWHRRVPMIRTLACGSCLSGARSAQRVLPHRSLNCVTQVCPERSAGPQTAGSPFLWVLSFGRRCGGEAKESTSPAGARPGLCRRR